MSQRYDIGRFAIPLGISALILIASLSVLPCTETEILRYSLVGQYFRIGGIISAPLLSQIVAMLLLAVWPLMFFSMDRLYPMRLGTCLPLLYVVFVFSCRDALCLSPVHIASFFLAWSVFHSFRASVEPYDADNPFLSMMFLSTASLFFVPLIWMAPLMAILDNNNSAQKVKTIIGSICGLLLPLILLIGIHAMASGFTDIFSPVISYGQMAVDIDAGMPQVHQSATLIKVLILTIATVWAGLSFLPVFGTLDVVEERCHLRCLFYGIWLAATAIVFGNSLGSLPWMLPLMPLSLFMFGFFNKITQHKVGVFLLSLMLLIIVAERIVILI